MSPVLPMSRLTLIKCDNNRDAFQCSRVYSRKLVSILFKYLPVVLKHVLFFAKKFLDDLLFIFLHVFQAITNVAKWGIYCKISFIHSPAWIVSHVSLLVQRNVHRRHTFRALYTKFLLKTRTREEFQHSTNAIVFLLKLMREMYYINLRATYIRALRFHITKSNFKSSIQRAAEGPTSTQLPTHSHQLPKHQGDVGGHKTRTFSADILEPYLKATGVSSKSSQRQYTFIDHVDDLGSLQYPTDCYTHTSLPLHFLFDILPLKQAKNIATKHGIPIESRCTMADLQARIVGHTCLVCNTHTSIFLLRPPNKKDTVKIHKQKKKSNMETDKRNKATIGTSPFPPAPLDSQLSHKIIASSCQKINGPCIEESGCAVCGELKPLKAMSRLKSVKNLLHILVNPGVTRKERKDTISHIQEFSGPVLDYQCNKICDQCRKAIRANKIPRLALANNLWIGKVPEELKCLRFVEKILIARVRHTCSFVKVASGMRKMKANVVAFESPIPKIYDILPPPRDDLDDVLAILFTGPCKPSEADISRIPFLIRRNHVMRALQWLKANHCDYANIEISTQNLEGYSETEPPVSIQYRASNTNKAPEGTSVFDIDIEDGTEEGDCSFTVHGLTGEILDTMTMSAIKAQALRHLNNQGRFLLVGQSKKLESMWNNPQLYPQMFPWLFPYGLGGIGTSTLSDKEHKRHLLMYHDKRFQVDINFPFVAFSHEQIKASTTQSLLLVDQNRFNSITDRLLNLDQSVLTSIVEKKWLKVSILNPNLIQKKLASK